MALLAMCIACKNPCASVTCNNGICIEGTCACDEGWTGNACNEVRVPTQILIERIELVGVPAFDTNGVPYDIGSPPDIELSIDIGEVISMSEPKMDCSDTDINWIYNDPVRINPSDITDDLTIIIKDSDIGRKQWMADGIIKEDFYRSDPGVLRHRAILTNNIDDIIVQVSYVY